MNDNPIRQALALHDNLKQLGALLHATNTLDPEKRDSTLGPIREVLNVQQARCTAELAALINLYGG